MTEAARREKTKDKRSSLFVLEGQYIRSKCWSPFPEVFFDIISAEREMRKRANDGQRLRIAVYYREEVITPQGKPTRLILCEECGTEAGISLPDGWQQYGVSRFPKTNIGSYCPACISKGE